MNQYRISEDTVSDLDGIWNYIAQDNIDAANYFLDAIFLKFSSLAAMPHMGKSREEFAPRLRSPWVVMSFSTGLSKMEWRLFVYCTVPEIFRLCSNNLSFHEKASDLPPRHVE